MLKSEYATLQVAARLAAVGTVTLDELVQQAWLFTDDGDPRWVMVALGRLERDGKITYPTCDGEHDHDDACTVKWAAS